MNNPILTDILLDGRTIILSGNASLADKITAFQSLVDQAAQTWKLAVIDNEHVLETLPPSATVITASQATAEHIEHVVKDNEIRSIALPSGGKKDFDSTLINLVNTNNVQLLLLNTTPASSLETLRNYLPEILNIDNSSAINVIRQLNPVVVSLDINGNISSIETVDLNADDIELVNMQ